MLTNAHNYRRVQMPQADQTTVELIIRPIKPSDAPALQTHHSQLSSQSVFNRFHGFKKEMTDEEARQLSTLDSRYQVAMIAVRQQAGQPDEIEGVARYYLTEPGAAELAIVVRDAYQNHGLGQALLEELIKIAQANNIHYLDALVLAENWHIRHLFHKLHYKLTTKSAGPVVNVRMHLDSFAQVGAS